MKRMKKRKDISISQLKKLKTLLDTRRYGKRPINRTTLSMITQVTLRDFDIRFKVGENLNLNTEFRNRMIQMEEPMVRIETDVLEIEEEEHRIKEQPTEPEIQAPPNSPSSEKGTEQETISGNISGGTEQNMVTFPWHNPERGEERERILVQTEYKLEILDNMDGLHQQIEEEEEPRESEEEHRTENIEEHPEEDMEEPSTERIEEQRNNITKEPENNTTEEQMEIITEEQREDIPEEQSNEISGEQRNNTLKEHQKEKRGEKEKTGSRKRTHTQEEQIEPTVEKKDQTR
jgi:hypothetical protein